MLQYHSPHRYLSLRKNQQLNLMNNKRLKFFKNQRLKLLKLAESVVVTSETPTVAEVFAAAIREKRIDPIIFRIRLYLDDFC